LRINTWPEEQRPRERLIKLGPSALSDAELLALFLRVGVKGKNAIDLSREILQEFGSIKCLFEANILDFSKVHGLGNAKYAQLHAALELSKRVVCEELKSKPILSSPDSVKNSFISC